MRRHFDQTVRSTGHPPKMDDAEKACRGATRCTIRRGRAAWKAVEHPAKRPPRGPVERQAG